MNVRHLAFVVAIVLICLSFVGASAAPDPVLVRSVIAGGGQTVTDGATFVLAGTIGEPIVGPSQVVGDYQAAAGFWPMAPLPYRMYMPAVQR